MIAHMYHCVVTKEYHSWCGIRFKLSAFPSKESKLTDAAIHMKHSPLAAVCSTACATPCCLARRAASPPVFCLLLVHLPTTSNPTRSVLASLPKDTLLCKAIQWLGAVSQKSTNRYITPQHRHACSKQSHKSLLPFRAIAQASSSCFLQVWTAQKVDAGQQHPFTITGTTAVLTKSLPIQQSPSTHNNTGRGADLARSLPQPA